MQAKTRLASKAKTHATKLADECVKNASDAGNRYRVALTQEEKLAALEEQSFYNQMAADWRATALRAEEISPSKFTGRNKGAHRTTALRIDFINRISEEQLTSKWEAIAAASVGKEYAKKTKELWPVKSSERQAKVLGFIRNHSKDLSLFFEN